MQLNIKHDWVKYTVLQRPTYPFIGCDIAYIRYDIATSINDRKNIHITSSLHMEKVTLYDLNEYIKRVMALNFQEPIWVSCEISQVSEVRGQVYLNVVQQDENTDQVTAQASAVVWYKSYLFIRNKLQDLLPSILTVGTHILIKVRVEFHERYGVKLVIEDIDPSYTIGQMEMARQKILQKLVQADVLDLNKNVGLPKVISKVAVISSATAAGYADFVNQLEHNEYKYAIKHTLYKAAMQGMNTEREVCAALDQIIESYKEYDCIVIIRGGGSKLDLSGFDNYNIGYKIATAPIPVITGIGHEIDQSVADITAHTAVKTPTAAAAWIIERNTAFESDILLLAQDISQMARHLLTLHRSYLDQSSQLLQLHPQRVLIDQQNNLDQAVINLQQYSKFTIKEMTDALDKATAIIKLSDPVQVLKRGYAMVQLKGNTITSSNQLAAGDTIELQYYDGTKKAEIQK